MPSSVWCINCRALRQKWIVLALVSPRKKQWKARIGSEYGKPNYFPSFPKSLWNWFSKENLFDLPDNFATSETKNNFLFSGTICQKFRGNRTIGCLFQELREANPAAERHQDPSEELRCLPQAQELAVVETLHQSQASAPGRSSIW